MFHYDDFDANNTRQMFLEGQDRMSEVMGQVRSFTFFADLNLVGKTKKSAWKRNWFYRKKTVIVPVKAGQEMKPRFIQYRQGDWFFEIAEGEYWYKIPLSVVNLSTKSQPGAISYILIGQSELEIYVESISPEQDSG